jgi:hypothetical protein
MIFMHTHQWIIDKSPYTGERKTQTRRKARMDDTGQVFPPRYMPGKTYSIQPGRGKASVGRIRIKRAWVELPADITDAGARAEGFVGRNHFLEIYEKINPNCADRRCWAYEFELLKP